MKNPNVRTKLVSRFSNKEKTVDHYFESATKVLPSQNGGSNVNVEYDEFWGVMSQYTDSWTVCESTLIVAKKNA